MKIFKINIKLLIFIIFVVLSCKISFATGMMIVGTNTDFTSYLEEDESGNDEIKKVCEKFVHDYITVDMSDFEREMQIIKYLTSNVVYDEEEIDDDDNGYVPQSSITDSFRAYGALVNHKAVCSGFAKAFELLGRYCGLQTMIVTGIGINTDGKSSLHAWNQICLDGEWYNVDITWEIPIKNEFINLTDMEFSKTHIRNGGEICTATKYGYNVVAYYLATGLIDTNIKMDDFRKSFFNLFKENVIKNDDYVLTDNPLKLIGAKFDDGSNYFINDEQINNYIKNQMLNGEKLIIFTTPANSRKNFSIDNGNWLNDNIDINADIKMQMLYEEGIKYDTRVIFVSIK